MDRVLPFGLHSTSKIFSSVADMKAWVHHKAGIQHLTHYLDDFLFLVATHGVQILSLALSVFSKLGVPVARYRTEGPACVITFLGICIETLASELCLPQEKLQCLRDLIRVWSDKKACTKK